jgi:hypothetical protein
MLLDLMVVGITLHVCGQSLGQHECPMSARTEGSYHSVLAAQTQMTQARRVLGRNSRRVAVTTV